MGKVRLASQTSSNKKRAAELASTPVIGSSSSSSKTTKRKTAETPAEYAIKAGIPAADLARAGLSSSVVQEVASAQKSTSSFTYGSESPLAAAVKTTTGSTTATTTSTSSAGKEYVFEFSGPISSKAVGYLSKLAKLLGGKKAYVEDQTKIVVVM